MLSTYQGQALFGSNQLILPTHNHWNTTLFVDAPSNCQAVTSVQEEALNACLTGGASLKTLDQFTVRDGVGTLLVEEEHTVCPQERGGATANGGRKLKFSNRKRTTGFGL